MSTTGNEYEKPGVNYPDREDAAGAEATPAPAEPRREPRSDGAEPTHVATGIGVVDGDHHGQDGGRESLTAAESQAALSPEQAQRLPAMRQNNADDVDKVAGIVAQTRSDVARLGGERVVQVLRERLEQAGVSLPDADVDELAAQITTGDEGAAED